VAKGIAKNAYDILIPKFASETELKDKETQISSEYLKGLAEDILKTTG
jgi:hypothetical protein